MKPYQPVRLDHIAKVNAAYDKLGLQWFAEHNHPMNLELFNNSLAGPVVVNDEADALIFLVRYDNTDTWRQEDKLKLESFRALRERLAALEDGPPSPERLY